MSGSVVGPVAVSGAAGFVGSHVAAALLARGHEVRGLLGPDDAEPVADLPGLAWWRGDIRDRAAVDDWLAGCEVVVHLAGPPSVRASFTDPAGTASVHVVGTATVLAAADAAGVANVVHVSSAEVYGLQECQPVSEHARPAPRSPYAAAKLGAEALVAASVRSGGPAATTLRPFSVYGPGQPGHTVLSGLLGAAAAGRRLTVADPTPVRDFVHVDDVAAAVVAATTRPPDRRWRPLNVASGRGWSIGEVASLIANRFGDDRPVGVTGTDRPADIPALVGDTTTVRTALGLGPPVGLDDWIADIDNTGEESRCR